MYIFTKQLTGRWLRTGFGLLLLGAARLAEAAPGVAPGDSSESTLVFTRRRLVAQYDSRYSIINGHRCTINGFKLGLELRGRMRVGTAVYLLSNGIPTRQPLPDNAAEDADAELRFRNLALYGEYVVLENNRWELSANLQAGVGWVYVLYRSEEDITERTPRDFMGLIEPSVAAQMRLFRWASLGAGAGWRQPALVPVTIRNEVSGPVFYGRVKILIGPLWHTMRHHERLFTQEGIRVRGLNRLDRRKFYGK